MEGDDYILKEPLSENISIHSLRMEGDSGDRLFGAMSLYFNPLPPHGGRLSSNVISSNPEYFNPLPPHGGRLLGLPQSTRRRTYFNPLPPHGGRLEKSCKKLLYNSFQSTPSAWRETPFFFYIPIYRHFISIHSLRMEGDSRPKCNVSRPRCHFNPLPPHGGRQRITDSPEGVLIISIHSLRMEGDVGNGRALHTLDNFNPLPPHGGRLKYYNL